MPDPEIKAFGDLVAAVWPGCQIIMEFSRFTEHRDSLSAELHVSNEIGSLHWSRINMASTTGRRDVIRALEDAHPLEGWRPMLDRACQLVATHLRAGEPAQEIMPTLAEADAYLVTPWIPMNEISVLYGPGGTAKSLFCLCTVIAGIMGYSLGGPWSVGPIKRALYLDWESGKRAHDRRAGKLLQAIETLPRGRMYHKRLRRPLTDVVSEVRAEAWKLETDVVVMDSLGAACGPEPESAGAALGALQALGSLPGTKLVIAHLSKAAMELPQGRPFGSVYVENTARSTIELRPRESEPSSLTVTLRHAKHNDGPKAAPCGMTFTFDDSGIVLTAAKADPGSQTLAQQILSVLSGKRGVADIADDLGANKASVRTELYRLAERSKVLRFPGGKGAETLWGRRDETYSN